MTVILDASSLSAFLLEEGDQKKVRELLIEGVCATELILTESCNAILTALRRKRIGEEDAKNAMEVLLSFCDANIKIFRQDATLLHDAYSEARKNDLAIYDSVYIALAKKLGGSIASRDPKQIDAAKKSGVRVVSA